MKAELIIDVFLRVKSIEEFKRKTYLLETEYFQKCCSDEKQFS